MTLVQDSKFKSSLSDILDYIAKDSKNRARDFKNTLRAHLEELTYMPYKYRKSIYFDDDNIRDYIFKGYCIPYVVDSKNEQLILLDILKWNIK